MASTLSSTRGTLRLLGYVRPYVLVVAVALVCSFFYGGGITARSYLLKPLMDDVVLPSFQAESIGDAIDKARAGEADEAALDAQREALLTSVKNSLGELILAGLALILVLPAVRLTRDFATDWLMTRVFVDMQQDVGSRLLDLPLSTHRSRGRGDFVARTTADTAVANQSQSLVFGDAAEAVGLLISALAAAFYLSWQLTLMVLLVTPPVALVLQIFGRRIRHYARARQEQIAEVVQRLIQMMSGMKVIKAFSLEAEEKNHLAGDLKRYFRRAMGVVRARVYSRALVELLTQAAFVVMLLVGIYAVVERIWGLTPGTLGAYLFIVAPLPRTLNRITRAHNSIQDALPAAERIFEIIDAPSEENDAPDAIGIERMREGIRYRDVFFSYGREPVLQGIDLEIGAGEIVALVGRTGVGKTTMADLLLRFGDPQSGSIEIDGIDIRRIKRRSLRDMMAVVTQEPFLFQTTILQNILCGSPEVSFDEVVEAARAAYMHDFIESLPEKYETHIGDLGGELSGGQRQRLTIARAILRNPQILIFDEATSALDAHAEQQVKEAIWNLMKGRTVLLIAHRLATVQAAHRIVVVEDGRVSMTGTHEELMRRGGLYEELVRLQFNLPT